MKKILCLFLTLLMLFSYASCTGPEESDEVLLSTVKALCEDSIAVNRLVFGEGILPKESGFEIGTYTEADPSSLSLYGVSSIADIEEKIESVYSLAMSAWIKNRILKSDKNEESGIVLTYARYYVGEVELEDKSKKQMFLVNTSYEATVGEVSYSNYRLDKKQKESVTFLVDITVSYKGESKIYTDERITIYKELHGWRLDTPTYATFVETP